MHAYDGSSNSSEINGLCFLLFLLDGSLSDETFMKWAKPVLSDFKVRGSWGTIGNQDVAANSFLSVMSVIRSSGWVIDGKQVTLYWYSFRCFSVIDLGTCYLLLIWVFDARFFNNELGCQF